MHYRLTTELAGLTAEELVAFSDEVVDIAHGLGEHVTLVGLSLGGKLVLWAAQHRADLDRAVVMAPLVAPRNVPVALVPLLIYVAQRLPNFFIWWDRKHKADAPGPQHAYPHFPTHGLAATLRVAQAVHCSPINLAVRRDADLLAHLEHRTG